jgi:hypothetical protein
VMRLGQSVTEVFSWWSIMGVSVVHAVKLKVPSTEDTCFLGHYFFSPLAYMSICKDSLYMVWLDV